MFKKVKEFLFGKEIPEKRKYKVTVNKRSNGLPIQRGVYNKKSQTIKSTIRRIFQHSNFGVCYIGGTEKLDSRWGNYKEWKFKHVLYETQSFKSAKEAEEDLIKYVTTKGISCNRDPKSKGLRPGADWYYIYILADVSCKLRD